MKLDDVYDLPTTEQSTRDMAPDEPAAIAYVTSRGLLLRIDVLAALGLWSA